MASEHCDRVKSCKNSWWCADDYTPERDNYECFIRQTNADRIRKMSDEELAAWLFEVCCLDSPFGCPAFDKKLSMEKSCREYWLDWLQQEVEQ